VRIVRVDSVDCWDPSGSTVCLSVSDCPVCLPVQPVVDSAAAVVAAG